MTSPLQHLGGGAAMLRFAGDSTPVMIWLIDANGKCVHLNRRLREFWGVRNEDLEGFDWLATLHPDDAPRVAAILHDAMRARRGFEVQMRSRKSTGDYRIVHTEAEPELSPAGELLGYVGVNMDVTKQVEAAEALKHSEHRFAEFMTHLPGLAWIKDGEGRYVYANDAAANAFGVPLSRLLGCTDAEIFPAEIATQFQRHDDEARASASGVRVIERLPHPDGTVHSSIVSKFSIPGVGSGAGFVGGVAIDVTDHKAAEERVRQLNEDLRHRLEENETLLSALPVAVFIARDPECRHITMNAAGARMLRLSTADNASKSGPEGSDLPFRILKDGQEVAPRDLIMQRAARLAENVLGIEVDVAFSDGTTITLHESASPLFDADGRVRGCVGVFVDITERKLAERQKSLLIDELNHRVKNTLAIVQSIASQTLRQTNDPQAFNAAFGARVETLAMAHSLLTNSAWEGVPLDDLVAASLAPFRTGEGRITMFGPSVMIKPAAAVTLCLVLHELATNAVKHGSLSDADGCLSVKWAVAEGMVRLAWRESGGPPVVPPTKRGFGLRLIDVSVDQLGGAVHLDHAPGGFAADLSFAL